MVIKNNFARVNDLESTKISLCIFRIVATYETALMRNYYNGRTETLRSVQCETVDWIRSFFNESDNVRKGAVQIVRMLNKTVFGPPPIFHFNMFWAQFLVL